MTFRPGPFRLRWHLLAWTVYIGSENLLSYLGTPPYVSLARTLLTFPLVIVLFYLNAHFVLPRFLPARRWPALLLSAAALVTGFAALRLLLFRSLLPLLRLGLDEYPQLALLTEHFLLDTVYLAGQYLLYSYGYWFLVNGLRLEREKRTLQASLFAVEKANMEAQLAFLRNQLNPHFLFNTFNFLYAKALPCSPVLADSILSLTAMMRSVTELEREKLIPLSQELTYLRHYLKLQQYRFGEALCLRFSVTGEEHAARLPVPPLLCITLVENVFKYGDVSEASDPAVLSFELEAQGFRLYVHNRKREPAGPAPASTAVGMPNITRQLEYYFPDRHSLAVQQTATHYSLTLQLVREAAPVPAPVSP